MYSNWLQISIPVVGLIIDCIAQIASLRFIKGLGLLKSEFLGCAAGFSSVILIELYHLFLNRIGVNDSIAFLIANLIIFFSLEYCYFTFINLGETARRIRILRELYDSPQGLSMEEILERYNAKEIIQKRLDRLLNNGQLLFRDGRFITGKPVMLFIANAIVALKLIALGKRSEFD